MIFPANLPYEQWTAVLVGERLRGVTLGRVAHRNSIVETGCESYRLRDAERLRRGVASASTTENVDAIQSER